MKQTILFFSAVISVSLMLTSCKPRTRTTNQEKYLRQAMISLRLDDTTKSIAYSRLSPDNRNAIDSILKSYENATEIVVTEEQYLNLPVTVNTTFENGKVLHQKAMYSNGTMAFEYYPVKNGDIVDSTLHYYPAGQLYSRTIVYADPSKWMFENYHENGEIRSRQYRNITNGWDENGNLVSEILFENDEVVKQTLFHSNGTKKWESHWKSDKFHGSVKEWDSLGTLVRSEKYKNGVKMK